MCWPFVVEHCVSTAPVYFIALMFGTGLMILLNPGGAPRDDSAQLWDTAVGVCLFFLLAGASTTAFLGHLPDPFGGLTMTVATGVGYFFHLVVGPIAFAAMVIMIGAVTTVVTHALIGEYA